MESPKTEALLYQKHLEYFGESITLAVESQLESIRLMKNLERIPGSEINEAYDAVKLEAIDRYIQLADESMRTILNLLKTLRSSCMKQTGHSQFGDKEYCPPYNLHQKQVTEEEKQRRSHVREKVEARGDKEPEFQKMESKEVRPQQLGSQSQNRCGKSLKMENQGADVLDFRRHLQYLSLNILKVSNDHIQLVIANKDFNFISNSQNQVMLKTIEKIKLKGLISYVERAVDYQSSILKLLQSLRDNYAKHSGVSLVQEATTKRLLLIYDSEKKQESGEWTKLEVVVEEIRKLQSDEDEEESKSVNDELSKVKPLDYGNKIVKSKSLEERSNSNKKEKKQSLAKKKYQKDNFFEITMQKLEERKERDSKMKFKFCNGISNESKDYKKILKQRHEKKKQ